MSVPPHNLGPRVTLARSVGMAATLYGYPVLEMMRTCRLQTRGEGESGDRPLINQLLHWSGPTQAEDRDVVTPANDLMYTTAWVNLADAPCGVQIPAAALQPDRYFVVALYDAVTENFNNLGPRNCAAEGETVWLVGPQGDEREVPAGARVVRCPTNLVWVLARFLVRDAADLASAKQLQAQLVLLPAPSREAVRRPQTVTHWQGDTVDPVAAVVEQGQAPQTVAEAFFANLCQALAEVPGRVEDAGHVASFSAAGLVPGPGFALQGQSADLREGLALGFHDAVQLLASQGRTRQPRPWVLSRHNGRYGSRYLSRAVVAYVGLGALYTDEALYAMAHFDADCQLLDGSSRYTLRFEAGDMPPAQAFWSVTLYDADRFLFANPLRRHALGDRSPGLHYGADGSLTLYMGPTAPALPKQWLPSPKGRFYLVLRLYHPSPEAMSWRIPPITPLKP